jgi:hypothetical protein
MIRSWWTRRPDAPVLIATGGGCCALAVSASAGRRALRLLSLVEAPSGPVCASADQFFFLVAPYQYEELGDLLYRHDCGPGDIRCHGPGGYLLAPPSRTPDGPIYWARRPVPGEPLPVVGDIVAILAHACHGTGTATGIQR